METVEWLEKVTGFQACCRGYLVRRALKHVRNEYEDVVKEIEGDLNDLQWKGTIVQIPTFPEKSISFVSHGKHTKVHKHKPLHVEVLEPERDTLPNANAEGVVSLSDEAGVGKPDVCQAEARKQGHTEDFQQTTAALSQLGLHPSFLQEGSRQCSLDKAQPRTCEEARMLRNKLAMELLWIQQAIASRKKYLILRRNLDSGSQQSTPATPI